MRQVTVTEAERCVLRGREKTEGCWNRSYRHTMAVHRAICVFAVLILLIPESMSQLSVCGRPALNTRIVGGQAAPEGSWPWQADLHRNGGHFCGGSLINNQWVMSAAHCFPSSSTRNLVVYLGRQSQEGSNPNEVSRTVTQIINHPSYNSATSDNDITLLQLSSPVTFTNYISPVCLAATDSTFFAGVNSWVTGWGNIGSGVPLPSPQNLMEVNVPIVGNRQCRCNYGVGSITDNMVCAGLREGGRDSCQGDSGGPLVIKQNNRWIQAGVVSFGRGCAEPNFPGVYTRVSQYNSWINSQISSNQPGFISFRSTGTNSDLSVNCPGLPPPPTPTPIPVVCGEARLNSRIVGGSSVATAGVWPWMASLQKNGSHVCGGTLVAVDSVLSNADCFSSSSVPSEWTVVLGRLRQNGSNPFEMTLNVTNITLSNLTGSNVAVLHLSTKPTLTNYIQPICLGSGRTFANGVTCWAAGWSSGRGGEEQVLQELQTSVVDCGNASTSANDICVSALTLEQGDSGGPLMCNQDGSWFQAVVLTVQNNSTSQTRANPPMVFTRLSRFESFLTQTLGTFLSPNSGGTNGTNSTTTNSGGTLNHSPFFLFFHFLFLLSYSSTLVFYLILISKQRQLQDSHSGGWQGHKKKKEADSKASVEGPIGGHFIYSARQKGGPFVIKQNDRWIQAGVVSFGNGCAEPNFPGVYTRVSQYNSWINSQISSNQPGSITFTSTGTNSDLSVNCTGLPAITATTIRFSLVCGRPALNTRIVGGQAAPIGSWPWQADLHSSGRHFCGGSLINNQWVMSAAHCFSSSSTRNLLVYLGRQSQEGSNPNEVSRTITQIINHPNYNSVTNDNDITLLRLSSPVTFTNFILPVCLAATDSTFFAGVNSWVTGWGNIGSGVPLPSPQNLMEVNVPIVGNRQCNCNYGVGSITDNMVCAGLREGGRDSCQGDSGGPLVIKQNNLWIQAGIVSFGIGCARPNFPGVYTRVSQYNSWINSQITSNQPGFISFRSTGTNSDLSVNCPGLPPITTTTLPPTTTTTLTTITTTLSPTTTTTTIVPPTTTTTTTIPPTPTPRPVVCGEAPLNSRIGGGSSVATAGVWPWMASLQKNGSHVCGGTLVAVDSVLSNADCFSSSSVPSEWTVVLGRLRQNGTNPFEMTLNVTNITLSNLTGSNVAVLHLSTKPTLTNYIQPICLDNRRTFAEGVTCWAAGWSSGRGGEEQVLQELQTSVVNCSNASTSASDICVSALTLEQGDSGGPLMCKQDGSWFQAVVLTVENNSTSQTRADPPMVFTRLSRFEFFLTQTLGRLLSPNSGSNNTNVNNVINVTTPASTNSITSGGTTNQSIFILFFHVLFLLSCLQLFL
ncbi:transmembrane protease serine 9-like [Mugil cephalus]|uniref:transmembrane protease serine 9-like n=1 Tax=Mugil cephalus TaxID=48193 RepID=UPI001FB70366|nr:transmembrane protease serine 9-like [Mugil cephalus]